MQRYKCQRLPDLLCVLSWLWKAWPPCHFPGFFLSFSLWVRHQLNKGVPQTFKLQISYQYITKINYPLPGVTILKNILFSQE